MKALKKRAIEAIETSGILLVFPIVNQPRPASLWSELHPKKQMKWEWDSDADGNVVELWHLKNELAASAEVAYAKWYKDRATFFSLPVFHAMLARVSGAEALSNEAREILGLLRERSPLSTKQIRAEAGLQGKATQGTFDRAMKDLWRRLLVCGVGEVADGAFPSLLVSATEHAFEDLWITRGTAPQARLDAVLAREPMWHDFMIKSLHAPKSPLVTRRPSAERGPGISLGDQLRSRRSRSRPL